MLRPRRVGRSRPDQGDLRVRQPARTRRGRLRLQLLAEHREALRHLRGDLPPAAVTTAAAAAATAAAAAAAAFTTFVSNVCSAL